MASTRRRIRRGLSGSALAAVAMAALTASQGTELLLGAEAADRSDGSKGDNDYPGRPYATELPPLGAPDPEADPEGPAEAGPGPDGLPVGPVGEAAAGIPAAVLEAYRAAEASLAASHPGCALEWELLAAIGKVESGHARGGALDAVGNATPSILGPVLDGNGFARITDTDGGRWDGDAVYDRAVGPMQFIPSTWAGWGADGNGDGVSDPNNVYDATLAAGHYLCAGSRDLSRPADLDRALLSYNNSREYVNTVLSWLEYYREGVHAVPDAGPGVAGGNSGAVHRDDTPSERREEETPREERRPAAAAPASPAPAAPGPTTPAPGRPGGSADPKPSPGTPAPGTPSPGTPAPGTPSPGTPAPGTPAPGTPAPGTPAPGDPDAKPGGQVPGPGTPPAEEEPTKPAPPAPVDPVEPEEPGTEDPEEPGECPVDPDPGDGTDPDDPGNPGDAEESGDTGGAREAEDGGDGKNPEKPENPRGSEDGENPENPENPENSENEDAEEEPGCPGDDEDADDDAAADDEDGDDAERGDDQGKSGRTADASPRRAE
ncbi:hypothetical protein [Streptomyces sp. ST2-7A]|uniref:hypothetical protein n=1 Tax=Streptomyces sp. ST2-7A TaxID=2907214 RepID=UPI0027E305AE|nr:hypothetical protein [Streptomyces sp. ST2-7A]